jgi:GNAT superfamily N-acetyltransferase
MNWYEKLNDYFPEQEMKNQQHLKDLLADQDVYHKEETDEYIALYAEFPNFIFIDYLLVTSKSRGKGIGTKVINRFKAKDKLILLEAEPKCAEDEDTGRRLEFYLRNGFKKAENIQYQRKDDDGELFSMHILYWPAKEPSQGAIMEMMGKACQEVHNYRSKEYYGRQVADPAKVLKWNN